MMTSNQHEEFVRLLTRAQPALRGYVLAMTGSFTETEDALQEVSAVLWEKYEQFDHSRSFVQWAFGVARLVILKSRRKYARHPLCVDSQLVEKIAERYAALSVDLDERHAHLKTCLEKLPPHQRQIVQLRYEDDLPLQAIAGRVNRSVSALQTLLTRIRSALGACIDRADKQEGFRSV